jgi:hypothetical protein
MSFFKNREQEDKIGPVWGGGMSGREEDMRKGCRRKYYGKGVGGNNMVETICTHG